MSRSRAAVFYRRGVRNALRTFEHDEVTISHAFRSPHAFLGGRTYGEALYRAVRRDNGRVDRVLEIGGGLGDLADGFLTAWTRDRSAAPPQYTLLDVSPKLAGVQRRRLRRFGRRVRFVQGDACTLRWPTGSLDGLVICNEVIAALDGDEVSLRDRDTAARLERWALRGLFGSRFIFPRGAALLLDGLARAAAPGTRVVLIDYFDVSGQGGQWIDLRGHRECAFELGLICHLARQSGWSVTVAPLTDYLGLRVTEPVATAPLVEVLVGLGHDLSPSRFWTRRDLARRTGRAVSGCDAFFDNAPLVRMLSSFHAIRLEKRPC